MEVLIFSFPSLYHVRVSLSLSLYLPPVYLSGVISVARTFSTMSKTVMMSSIYVHVQGWWESFLYFTIKNDVC